jgi:hypothetical protein
MSASAAGDSERFASRGVLVVYVRSIDKFIPGSRWFVGPPMLAAAVLSRRLRAAPAQKPAYRHNGRPHKAGMIMIEACDALH